MRFKVRATIKGKRIDTDIFFRKKSNAQRFANETNSFRQGANARVINFPRGAK